MLTMQLSSTLSWSKPLPAVTSGSLLLETKSSRSHPVVRNTLCAHEGERRISQRDPDLRSTPKLDEGLKSQCLTLPPQGRVQEQLGLDQGSSCCTRSPAASAGAEERPTKTFLLLKFFDCRSKYIVQSDAHGGTIMVHQRSVHLPNASSSFTAHTYLTSCLWRNFGFVRTLGTGKPFCTMCPS